MILNLIIPNLLLLTLIAERTLPAIMASTLVVRTRMT